MMLTIGLSLWKKKLLLPFRRFYLLMTSNSICASVQTLGQDYFPCSRLRVPSPRCLLLLCALTLFTFILLSCLTSFDLSYSTTWFSSVLLGKESVSGNESCLLICPDYMATAHIWKPRAFPTELACKQIVPLPVSCPQNRTLSELLTMEPIQFLSNFKSPCWYEKISSENPYIGNLFTCFSPNARKVFQNLYLSWMLKLQTDPSPRRLRCLPYFYIAGMPKSGSTDLYHKMSLHPDIVRAPMKEPHWWSKNRFGMQLNYSSNIPFKHYVDLFDRAAQQVDNRMDFFRREKVKRLSEYHSLIIGDASASTLWDNDNWWRLPENCGLTEPDFTNAYFVHRITPSAKIIAILRDPTERLYSDYLYFQKVNKSVEDFHEQVILSIQKLEDCLKTDTLRSCLYNKVVASGVKVRLRVGIYHVYIRDWLKIYPRSQIMIFRLEDYAVNPLSILRNIFTYLGLRQLSDEEEELVRKLSIANSRHTKDRDLGPMWLSTQKILQDFYRPHNRLLVQLLTDSRYFWNDVTH